MQHVLLPFVLHALFLGAGAGVLRVAGFPSLEGMAIVATAGLAYLCGLAVVLTSTIALLTLGAPLSPWLVAAIASVCTLPATPQLFRGFLRGIWSDRRRRNHGARPPSPEQRVTSLIWVATTLLLAAAVVMIHSRPVVDWDAWAIWTQKAEFLYYYPDIPVDVFTSRFYLFFHPDYPILLPMLEALHFGALGRVDSSEIFVVLGLLFAAWIAGMKRLADGLLRPTLATPLILSGAVLLAPGLLSGLADVPVVLFLSLAALALGRWVARPNRPELIVAMILLGAAAGTKNEGLSGSLALMVAAGVALLIGRNRRALRSFGWGAAITLMTAVVPLHVWLSVHHIPTDLPLTAGLNPVNLLNRADRVWPALTAVIGSLAHIGTISVFVPFALALMCVLWRREPTLVAFYFTAIALYVTALVWAYWISPYDLRWHLDHSLPRVSMGVSGLSLAALIQLGGAALTPRDTAPASYSRAAPVTTLASS